MSLSLSFFFVISVVLFVEGEDVWKTLCHFPAYRFYFRTVAWWVNATPLQLPPTPSPPHPIHPALLPTHLTHSDVSRCKGGRRGSTLSPTEYFLSPHLSLPSLPFRLLTSLLASFYFSFSLQPRTNLPRSLTFSPSLSLSWDASQK